ncbi:hypothetical protein L195_g062475, partial [Trifolium pratense]
MLPRKISPLLFGPRSLPLHTPEKLLASNCPWIFRTIHKIHRTLFKPRIVAFRTLGRYACLQPTLEIL